MSTGSQTPNNQRARVRSDRAHHQALRFLVVGATTVAIDFVVYQALYALGVPLDVAKACSFVTATVCAYFLNRSFTFGARGGRGVAVRFVVLYALAFVVNVGVNALMLRVLDGLTPAQVPIVLAFLVAQACSSTLNFFGMRHLVFTDRGRAPL